MTFIFRFLLTFLFVFTLPFSPATYAGHSTSGQPDHVAAPTAGTMPCLSTVWPHEKSDLLPDPNLIFGRLKNGFRYVLLENREPRDRVSMHLVVLSGSLNETDEQQGLAHFLEHMLFNGSEHFPPGELIKYFQSIGMRFGADANAATGFSKTVYHVLLPSGSREDLGKGLLVMKDYAGGALLLESEIDRERGIVLAEKQARDSAGYRTWVASTKFVYEDSKYSKRFPIGKEDVIKNGGRDLIKQFYDAWYRPENMILVVVGDFSVNTLEPLIKNRFSNLSARSAPGECPDMGKVSHKGNKTFYHYEKEAGNTEIAIQAAWSTTHRPDSSAFQKELLTSYIADGILRNRLDIMTRKPDCPFTSASAYSGIFLNQLAYAKLYGISAPEKWEETLKTLSYTMRQAIMYGFAETELDRVKKEIIAGIDSAVLEKNTRDSRELAGTIIDNLTDDKVFQSPEQERDLYRPFVKSLTLDRVNHAFKKTWDHGHRLIPVTGNAEIKRPDKKPEDVILEIYKASLEKKVKRGKKERKVNFPYLDDPAQQGRILDRRKITDLEIEQIDFSNGVRLNLKKSNFKENEVTCVLSFGRGKKREPAPGLAMPAESVLNQSGLGNLDRDELDRALAGKNTFARFHINEDSFSFFGSTVSKELPLLFQLLYAHVVDPGFRKDAFHLTMRQFDQMYEGFSHSIDGAMELYGKNFLAGGDSRFGLPPYEEFSKLTLGQVRNWIEPELKKGCFELSITGDFDPETVIDLAGKYFGSLPCGTKQEDVKEQIDFPAGKELFIDVETMIDKVMIVVAWPTEDFWDISRTRRLSVLGHVFTERMRNEIREKLGATYSPYAYNDPSRTYDGYGLFKSVLVIDPKMTEKMIGEIKRISSDLAANGITEDELKRSLDPVRTSIKDMMRTNRYWLSTVMSNSKRYPVQLDWSRTIRDDYAAVTVTDISELAAKYLDNRKTAVLVLKPVRKLCE